MGTPKQVRPAPGVVPPPAGNQHELTYLFVEITTQCNLNCLHCGSDCRRGGSSGGPSGGPSGRSSGGSNGGPSGGSSGGPSGGRKKHLPPEAILKVLREIRRRYDPRRITVALSGGEPLCYPGLFDLGREIAALEFPWGLVTNGYAWTPDKLRQAYSAGLHSISVGLDGLGEEHDWLRGKEGAFSKAIETISLLRRHPYWKAMDVLTCVNQRNLPVLDRMYLLLRALGVRDWRLYTVSPIGGARAHPELFLTETQFKEMIQKIQTLRSLNQINVNYSESGYLGHKVERAVRDYPYFCQAGIHVAGIMVNGDILACPNIDRRFSQGNIFRDSFPDIWEHGYQPFRDRSWMRTGKCKTCSEWEQCQGNSFHLWDVDQGKTRLCHCHEYHLLDE